MVELLRDPFWQSVAALVTLAAIFVSVALWYLTSRRTRKALSFEIVTSTSLLTVGSEIEQRTQILFDGAPVQDLSLLLVRINNSGMVPILSSDFEQPLTITLAANTQIFDIQVTETDPYGLPVRTATSDVGVTLAPLLLNPSDSFTLKLLIDNTKQVDVGGRIVGVKEINQYDRMWTDEKTEILRKMTKKIERSILLYIVFVLIVSILNTLEFFNYYVAHPLVKITSSGLLIIGGLGVLLLILYAAWSIITHR